MFSNEPKQQTAFLVDARGVIASWNANCAATFGLPAAQAVGHPFAALLAGDALPDWDARWQTLPAARQPGDITLALAASGCTSFNLAPQQDAAGRFSGAVLSVTSSGADDTEAARVGRTPMSAIVEMFPGTFYALNRERRFVLWNRNLELMSELAPDELAAANVLEFFDVKERSRIADAIRRVFDEGAEVQVEAEYLARSGRAVPVLLCGTLVPCVGGDYLFGMGLDMSARRQQERTLRLRERALHAASNGIVITRCAGQDNPIEYVNPAFERITGYHADEVIGRDSRFMAAPDLDLAERAEVRAALEAQRAAHVVFRNTRKNGELFWNELSITPVADDDGVVSHFIGIINDVTASKQRTAHLEHEVNHDALTGLANRNLLWDRLEQAVHLAQRHKSLVATVLIDLNNFKGVNDSFGHEAGDVVLQVVAKRLQASVRDSDTVARLSGDEFVLVLVNQPSLRYTLRMIERVRAALVMPVAFNRREIAVSASLGVAVFPHDGATAAELVRTADVAMYHAKSGRGSDVAFFSADMKSATEARQRLESGMRDALQRNELFLVYQPRIDIHSGQVKGFECLLRWRHPEQGVMLPSAFLAEAEESGAIVPIGAQVLDQACLFLARLKALGHGALPLSVNVSQREFSQHDFVSAIGARLQRHGLAPASLQVEVREDALIRNPGLGRDLAAQLRELGIAISVDAFGEGISDLSYLQQLELAQVKLARSTMRRLADGAAASRLAKTLIDIAHNLGMAAIGDAVETRAQMEFLKSIGCDQIQGAWFSEPLAADEACELLGTSPQFA